MEVTKKDITKSLPVIDDSNMIELALSVLSKLNNLSPDEFKQLDFANTLSKENVEI